MDRVKQQRAKDLRRVMTRAEAVLWARLRTNQLDGFHFYRQKVIAGFIVDFYCRQANLVVEVDGEVHHDQIEYDAERDQVLAGYGLTVLRFSNEAVTSRLADVLATIATACHQTSSPFSHSAGRGLGG